MRLFDKNKVSKVSKVKQNMNKSDISKPSQLSEEEYLKKFDNDLRRNFQFGIQFYNDGFDYLTMRDRPVPEKLGWLFSQKINDFKDSLFERSFMLKTTEETYEPFKTQFFEGLYLCDKNGSISEIKNKDSAKYIGFLFARIRTEFGEILLNFCLNHYKEIHTLNPPDLINKTWNIFLSKDEDYKEIHSF